MSLRWKIAGSMATLAGVIAMLAAAGAYLTASRQLYSSVDDALVAQAGATAMRSNGGPRGPGRPGLPGDRNGGRACPEGAELRSLHSAQIISVGGEIVACLDADDIEVTPGDLAIAAGRTDDLLDDLDHLDDDGTTPAGAAYTLRTDDIHGEPTRIVTMALPDGGAVQLARSLTEADHVLDELRIRLLGIAFAGIIAAAVVGFALATRIVRPIRRLTTTAHHIAETRDLSTEIPPGGNDEIGSLSESFTSMVESLAESRDQQQRLISDASHEMRTPLTSLRTNLELLARVEHAPSGSFDPAERRAVIDDLEFETNELTSLLTELVELATDQSGGGETPEPTDLADLCRGVAERTRRRTDRDIRVEVVGSPATVVARQHALERAVSNLVDNAVKYSPDAQPVDLIVDGGSVRVRDRGAGIADADLPRIFDRFYRATSARTAPGSGLGLAIVAQIIQSHGGTVSATNAPDGGAVVGFTIPVEESSGQRQTLR